MPVGPVPGDVAAVLDRRLLPAADGRREVGGGRAEGDLPGPAVDQEPGWQPECGPDDPVAEQRDDRFDAVGPSARTSRSSWSVSVRTTSRVASLHGPADDVGRGALHHHGSIDATRRRTPPPNCWTLMTHGVRLPTTLVRPSRMASRMPSALRW